MKWHRCVSVTAGVLMAVSGSLARAEISLEFVTVGNAGNAADATGFGAVDYEYAIGKYEVTAGQYTAFLNAVAATDTYGLYNTKMWSYDRGCQIQRSGSAGSYAYSVAADRADRPVNYVSWGDAARFVNWLHNGQGTGSTETGAYTLNGAMSLAELMAITRDTDARYCIGTEDEWYKAAYHKNDGVTGNYWDYPTSSDNTPSNDLLPIDPGNNANFWLSDYTIGSPYHTTEVGAFTNSDSPYGTFDQGGNLTEWNETAVTGSSRGARGGNWNTHFIEMGAHYSFNDLDPTLENFDIGFRVASVPEPGSITMMAFGAVAGALWWRRRKSAPATCAETRPPAGHPW